MRFRMSFEFLFYAWGINLCLGVISHAIPYASVRNALHSIMTIISYGIYIVVVWLYYSRFKHSGGVCCGDYLTDEEEENPAVNNAHLIEQGLFLKWSLIAIYSSLFCTIGYKLC